MDGHQGWEWIEGFQAVSNRILQPALKPLRSDVCSFLWHGFDPGAVARHYASPVQAAQLWSSNSKERPYGMIYVGHNWQRWSQMTRLSQVFEPLCPDIGPICLAGCDWDKRPEWAEQLGVLGANVEPELLKRVRVQTKPPIPFDEVISFTGQARFSPII